MILKSGVYGKGIHYILVVVCININKFHLLVLFPLYYDAPN